MTAAVETVERPAADRARRRRFGAVGLATAYLAIVVVCIVVPGIVAPADPYEQDILNRFGSPDGTHWLGTDELGRDVFSRLIFGARVSMLAGLEVVGIAAVVGVPLGLVAAWSGPRVDNVINRLNDALMSLPGLVLALAFVAVIGPSVPTAMLAVGLVFIPRFFRVSRATTLSIKRQPFVEGLAAVGVRSRAVLLRHVLPNGMGPLIVEATIVLSAAIIAEASLSFLGLAAQPPTASWGSMLSSAQQRPDLLHLVLGPGIALSLTVLAFTVLGDRLRAWAVRGDGS